MRLARSRTGIRRNRQGRSGRRDDTGETLGLLVLWPALIVGILLLLVHAFIVTNAQSEAQVAASRGLRSAWRFSANEDFLYERVQDLTGPGVYTYSSDVYMAPEPHPAVLEMVEAVLDTVAQEASGTQGWRWWTPGATQVFSDWCALGDPNNIPDPPAPPDGRPTTGESGWVRVVVTGEVFGPLAALWPDRLDRVYAVAEGPTLQSVNLGRPRESVPLELPPC